MFTSTSIASASGSPPALPAFFAAAAAPFRGGELFSCVFAFFAVSLASSPPSATAIASATSAWPALPAPPSFAAAAPFPAWSPPASSPAFASSASASSPAFSFSFSSASAPAPAAAARPRLRDGVGVARFGAIVASSVPSDPTRPDPSPSFFFVGCAVGCSTM